MRREMAPGLAIASLTKSMLQGWLTVKAATSGTRTPYSLCLLALSGLQTLSRVDAVHPLVIDARKLGAQNVMNDAVAPAPALMGGLYDLLAQLDIERTGLTLMTIGISA